MLKISTLVTVVMGCSGWKSAGGGGGSGGGLGCGRLSDFSAGGGGGLQGAPVGRLQGCLLPLGLLEGLLKVLGGVGA